MAKSLDARVKEIVASGEFGAVIQCGGRGRRAGIIQPKPLADLGNGERPLSNVLLDLPATMPMYLHLLREQRETYRDFLDANSNFGSQVSYLVQQEGRLLGDDKAALFNADGTQVLASNGSATFMRQLVKPPEFIALVDGAKPGVYYPDVFSALKMLVKDESLDAIVFARRLSNDKMKLERKNHDEGHTRYARLNDKAQAVYEHPKMKVGVIENRDWLGLAGMYIVRSVRYMDKTARMKGVLMKSESVNTLISKGLAYHLKMAMTLKGYNGRRSGLTFQTFEPTRYIPGIKTPKDIADYSEWEKQGIFDYRSAGRPWRDRYRTC
jgi:hypothetical protein